MTYHVPQAVLDVEELRAGKSPLGVASCLAMSLGLEGGGGRERTSRGSLQKDEECNQK